MQEETWDPSGGTWLADPKNLVCGAAELWHPIQAKRFLAMEAAKCLTTPALAGRLLDSLSWYACLGPSSGCQPYSCAAVLEHSACEAATGGSSRGVFGQVLCRCILCRAQAKILRKQLACQFGKLACQTPAINSAIDERFMTLPDTRGSYVGPFLHEMLGRSTRVGSVKFYGRLAGKQVF